MLTIENVSVRYDHIQAIRQVSFEVHRGEIVTLVGANGAGKSTTLKTISGLLRPAGGTITFNNRQIDRLPPEEIVALGIAHVPEGRRVFPGLTVQDNLEVATVTWKRRGQSIKADMQKIYQLFPRLEERKAQMAWSLSGGEQQMLAVGRALMARPQLLLLDEPSLGLAPSLVRDLFDKILEIRKQGCTILLVEQNAFMALATADRGYIMENGEITLHDTANNLRQNERVREAYFGG